MKNMKKRFDEDPVFAITVIAVAIPIGTALLNAVAKNVTAAAYAYRASKL